MSCSASQTGRVLLVNPWIHDFAAYDHWARPYGLLMIAAILRQAGYQVHYLDCLDRFHHRIPQTSWPSSQRQGRGPFLKTPITKPQELEEVPRNYARYGILPEWFREDLQKVSRPDLIMVSSMMTYWYPGVFETIFHLKQIFPGVPLLLGGVYATLCTNHARKNSGADFVFEGLSDNRLMAQIAEMTGGPKISLDWSQLDKMPFPAFGLQSQTPFIPLITAIGCPFQCAYCASSILAPRFISRQPDSVIKEIKHWNRQGIKDFVFYDDALLVNSEKRIIPILESVIQEKMTLRFHTPNALHLIEITPKIADLMMHAGFKTLRLGLETTAFAPDKRLDKKVDRYHFLEAVQSLKTAGFTSKEMGAYLLVGLPGQTMEEVEKSMALVGESGIDPVPAYYTPIPGTALWPKAVAASRYDLTADPIFTNNSIFPCWDIDDSWKIVTRLKNLRRGFCKRES